MNNPQKYNLAAESNIERLKPLQEDIKKIKNDFQETKNSIYQTYDDAKDLAKNAVHQSIEQVRHQSQRWQDQALGLVRSSPIRTIGIAMLVGVLAGRLFNR
ncbi:MAG: hypothetical protein H0W64_10370 [Gammaproteobacteria bacterium]|nr:hypothetical protein [Gammaproteobacteria bacterium]